MHGPRTWLLLLCLAGCGGGGGEATPAVSVYRSVGSLQCSGGGTPVAAMQNQLISAGVQVLASSCGLDGNSYPAVCGQPDGQIGIFDVPVVQQALAEALGFALLSSLPQPVRRACGA